MLWRLLPLLSLAAATNFDWEKIQLERNATDFYPDVAFGDASGPNATYAGPRCKVGPGDAGWPADGEWDRFNATLGGVLIKPVPPGAVCYPGAHYDLAKCTYLLTRAGFSRFYLDDPVSTLTAWPQGGGCPVAWNPTGRCTQGGYPAYVVNASTVRHIQLAVNFARNRNLRLVIKNAGHDFGGRNTGAGALSIWTHFLKEFEYIPQYTVGPYKGRVARVSAGIEAWELYNYMGAYNMTMVVPGGDTVGAYGGWTAGGGHNFLSSSYGNGADQVLEFKVVTADGKYRTVTPHQNADLFFAMLGGGGSTYGVLTSAIVKAYPLTPVTNVNLAFSVGSGGLGFGGPGGNFSFPPGNFSFPPGNASGFPPFFPPGNASGFPPFLTPGNTSFPPGNFPFPGNGSFPAFTPPVTVNSTALFWEGVRLYQYFSPVVLDAGGTLYSNIRTSGPGAFSFATTFKLINKNAAESVALLAPLFAQLNALSIPVTPAPVQNPDTFTAVARTGVGGSPGNLYFGSRFFPRANWANETIYNATFAAIRGVVEAGYAFHGVEHHAPVSVAGYPGNMTAINPTWRGSVMHADIYDSGFRGVKVGVFWEGHKKLRAVMDILKRATPAGGAYYNEGDVLEPDWQRTFFGSYYGRLVGVKRARDPWGLFWAPTMPGSESWAVVTTDGLPTQDGPLCQTGYKEAEEAEEGG